jgi:hypothetical protein
MLVEPSTIVPAVFSVPKEGIGRLIPYLRTTHSETQWPLISASAAER